MNLIPVNSSAIRAVGYDGFTLVIVFRSSCKRYQHRLVPQHVYAGLMNASSKGWYYRQYIRGRYY